MTLEKLEAFVHVMNNEQYNRFQSAVMSLISDNIIFSENEMKVLEKKIMNKQSLKAKISSENFSFNVINMATN